MINEKQRKELQARLNEYRLYRGGITSVALCDLLVEADFSFLVAEPVAALETTDPEIPYPKASFFLRPPGGASKLKYPGTCIRCHQAYEAGASMFHAAGKGCFCPTCISPKEKEFYRNTASKFFYNYLCQIGEIEKKNKPKT